MYVVCGRGACVVCVVPVLCVWWWCLVCMGMVCVEQFGFFDVYVLVCASVCVCVCA